MSATNSNKSANKSSVFEKDLKDINLSGLMPRQSPQQIAGNMMLVLSGFSLILSLIYIVLTGMRLNQTNIPPQDGQLLNRASIEKAAQLLQEETVVFSPESAN